MAEEDPRLLPLGQGVDQDAPRHAAHRQGQLGMARPLVGREERIARPPAVLHLIDRDRDAPALGRDRDEPVQEVLRVALDPPALVHLYGPGQAVQIVHRHEPAAREV